MFILKKGHQPGVYVPPRALFLVRSCDLFYLFIRTCLGLTVIPVTITSLELFCVLTMCYFTNNVSSKENIKILWLIFMFYYSDIIAIKNSYWFFSFTEINYDFRLVIFLAHLSRRLIGELLVYRGIRRPSVVRPSSTFSNDFFSEAPGSILLIFHI